jgi:hypothetical protein
MILHEGTAGLMVIAQPAHAVVAGQLAEAWGNADFGGFAPRREVCLAAACHDLGWLEWELAPTWNPATGRPQAFDEVPSETHVRIWSSGPQRALAMGRYVALLISRHGTALFGAHCSEQERSVEPVKTYLAAQTVFQNELLESLRADPVYAPYATPACVGRNQAILRVTDALSLYASMGLHKPQHIESAPTANGSTTLLMSPQAGSPARVAVSPWPFSVPKLNLTVEGRSLNHPCTSEEQFKGVLARSRWFSIPLEFVPG